MAWWSPFISLRVALSSGLHLDTILPFGTVLTPMARDGMGEEGGSLKAG